MTLAKFLEPFCSVDYVELHTMTSEEPIYSGRIENIPGELMEAEAFVATTGIHYKGDRASSHLGIILRMQDHD